MSLPSTRIVPSSASYNLKISFSDVLFAAPFSPTMTQSCPGLIVKDMFLMTYFVVPGYLKDTFLEAKRHVRSGVVGRESVERTEIQCSSL